ncbi:MAG TPA: NAD(P)/FAD-dependent oxidoreductase [Pseudonocardia sp.]|uniref:NAD(P)/FAD-dependent oxidoreductase n=1 Tax=Pseudonocardia sp. TaxID=60912 RepID=UPI002ED96788
MSDYDAIIVGARCAGSPTAMLLARQGYRVLLVDRASFPSDIMSTHLVHHPGMARLRRWGLADHLVATGCPAIETYRFDFGPFAIAGTPRAASGAPRAYAPRRRVLDALLLEAAAQAGAEVRTGCSVEELLLDGGTVLGIRARTEGGARHDEHARVVIGADGVHSLVARAVRAPAYRAVPAREAMYYSYWSGMPTGAEFQVYIRPTRALVAIPTHDGLTCVVVAWSIDEFEANRHDVEGNYLKAFDAEPAFAERMSQATREERFVGTTMDGFYRKPYGPGWALVGDAGYHKDACTAQGITDAFQHAELLADALDSAFTGRQSYEEALAGYQRTRDDTTGPMYELTADFASFDPPPVEMQQLLAVVAADPGATEDFLSVQAGTMPVPEFFDPANLARYLDRANAVGAV